VAISGRLKWFEGNERFGDSRNALFDLVADPNEKRNRSAEAPDTCMRLEASARDWERALHPHAPVNQRTGARMSPTERHDTSSSGVLEAAQEKLRALGYAE
jgi:hypothetical protein